MKKRTEAEIQNLGYAMGFAECLRKISVTVDKSLEKNDDGTMEGIVDVFNDTVLRLFTLHEELEIIESDIKRSIVQSTLDMFEEQASSCDCDECNGYPKQERKIVILRGGKR